MGTKTLLLGRAGSGKTRRLMDRVAGFLREARERDALLLVPTLSQASHVKRLFLSRYDDLSGFFDESVVTFTSLVEKILPDRPIGELLSGLRQDLFLRHVLRTEGPKAFRPFAGYPGFRRAALSFIKELKQNGLPAEEVAERLSGIAGDRGGAARERLLAFRDLFLAYESLREVRGATDHEDALREARDALRADDDDLAPAWFGIDGFQNFTVLERELLLLVSDRAEETVVTLPWDSTLDADRGGHFRVAAETHDFLLERRFRREPLDENHRARAGALAHLEAHLFRPTAPGEEPPAADAGDAFRALEAADPADEADRVARTVVRLVSGDFGREYRYQDIVVILREVAGREERFRRAFLRHGVPLRVYGSTPLAHHPFLRAALALLRLAGGAFESRRVLALLRSDAVTGIDRGDVDRLEFDLREHGEPATPESWVERVRGFTGAGADLLAALIDEPSVEQLERRLVPIWRRDPAADVGKIRREGQAVAELRRAVEEVRRAFRLTGHEPSLPEFTKLLAEVLSESGGGSRERRLDAVNLIGAREARQWEAPVVIVSGLVEGEFPVAPREDLFLPDEDRRWTNENRRLALRERALDREEERYLYYVAMTRARERLFLTWPATDGTGRETLRSLCLKETLRLFGGIDAEFVSRRRLSEALPKPEEAIAALDLHRRALTGLATRVRPKSPAAKRLETAAALSDLLVAGGDPAYRRALELGARFHRPPRAVIADPTPFGAPRLHSASALTDFAICPFRHFAGRTLRLQPPPVRPADGLDALILGEIAHETLRALFEEGPPDPDRVPELLSETFAAIAPNVTGLAADRARRDMEQDLVEVARRERERLAGTDYAPRHFETDFGREDRVLAVTGPEGEDIHLTGRVDRIDAAPDGGAVIIDYKYSKRGFDRQRQREAEEGVHFQLPLYLLAARDVFGYAPRGAWLMTLRDRKTSGYACEGGPAPDKPVDLDEEGLAALLDRTSDAIVTIDARIRAGEIDIRPREPADCTYCDFGDLCRFENWMAE